ncbi:MAG: diadenylate cyclase CdaA [Bacteroidales bacterium]|nr:diadenylate cyclase CdaA [Bacteroidales bacterium]
MFEFFNIELIDVIDITMVAVLIYQTYKLMRGTAALNIFTGILVFYFIWLIVRALKMELVSALLGQVIEVGVIALIVLFQQEIRRFLLKLGTSYMDSRNRLRFVSMILGTKNDKASLILLDEVTNACSRMSENRTGALIVLAKSSSLEFVIETGDRIDALINRRLIENIFFKNTPLHDGAIVIGKDKIIAARCTLPISENPHIPPSYGMRHRAAVGISEATDSNVIVVSEENGEISFVSNGVIRKMNSINELRLAIESSYSNSPPVSK